MGEQLILHQCSQIICPKRDSSLHKTPKLTPEFYIVEAVRLLGLTEGCLLLSGGAEEETSHSHTNPLREPGIARVSLLDMLHTETRP